MITFKQFITESNSMDSIIDAAVSESTRRYDQPFLTSPHHEEILQFARDMHKTLHYTKLELEPLTPTTAGSPKYLGSIWFKDTRELDKWGLDLVIKAIYARLKKLSSISLHDGLNGIYVNETGSEPSILTRQPELLWDGDNKKSLMILVILEHVIQV